MSTLVAELSELTPTQEHPVAVDASILVVSFNTRDLLRQCLQSLQAATGQTSAEIIVVDNASVDGSADMVELEFPDVKLVRSPINLGFGNANNAGARESSGRYIVLVNSDAFLHLGALECAVTHMDATPDCGIGGARLVDKQGELQPSARSFHSILADFGMMTGLAGAFPKSRIFARLDRTWTDPLRAREADWVPGAFSIIRRTAWEQASGFDPAFFLYYEEVDLCKRIKNAGYSVWYWPDIVVTHLGGESSKQLNKLDYCPSASQVVLWRMRSTLLYYRKHHGSALFALAMEDAIYRISALRNRLSWDPRRQTRAEYFDKMSGLLRRAWEDTKGGTLSPAAPW